MWRGKEALADGSEPHYFNKGRGARLPPLPRGISEPIKCLAPVNYHGCDRSNEPSSTHGLCGNTLTRAFHEAPQCRICGIYAAVRDALAASALATCLGPRASA